MCHIYAPEASVRSHCHKIMSAVTTIDNLDVEPDGDPERCETDGDPGPSRSQPDDSDDKIGNGGGLLSPEDVVVSPTSKKEIDNMLVAEETSGDVSLTQEVKDKKFWMACRRGDLAEVRYWLTLGANVNTEQEYWKPLWGWESTDRSSVKSMPEEDIDDEHEYLNDWERGDQKPQKRKARTLGVMSAMFVAVKERHLDVAQDLLEHRDIILGGRYTKEKDTAFSAAASLSGGDDLFRRFLIHSQLVEYLDVPSLGGYTPLCQLAVGGVVDRVRLILQHGANVNSLDSQGCSPLFLVIQYTIEPALRLETARLLLAYGADVNLATQGKGESPLHEAARKGDADLINLLLTWGARENAVNNENLRPVDCVPAERSDVKPLFDPINVRKLKKDRQDPWKSLQDVVVDEVCNEFALSYTCCGLSTAGRVDFESSEDPLGPALYHPAGTDRSCDEQMESWYCFGLKIREKESDIYKPEMTWVKALFGNVFHSYDKRGKREEFWDMMDFFDQTPTSGSGESCQLKPHVECCFRASVEAKFVSMAIPYIDFESDQYLDRLGHEEPEPGKQRKLADLKKAYPHPFDGASGIQHPRTLDQAYNHDGCEANSQSERDRDQVVYKGFRQLQSKAGRPSRTGSFMAQGQKPGEPPEGGIGSRLLMVNQLWLWKLGDGTVITASPERWHNGPEHTLFQVLRQSAPTEAWRSPDAFIEHALSTCITFPLDLHNLRLGFNISEVFESWIGHLSAQEVASFKKFCDFLDKLENAATAEAKQRLSKDLDAELSVTKEVKLIYEVRDVLDEIFMIRQICKIQDELLSKSYLIGLCKRPSTPWGKIQERSHGEFDQMPYPRRRLQSFVQELDRLEEKSKRVLENLNQLVQVKQAQSSLNESKLASLQAVRSAREAERSHELNNYIMLFTVVTVIFTPLSFMSAMFALSIEDFPLETRRANLGTSLPGLQGGCTALAKL
ncbi:hypothetical protein QBC42DRAFT_344196 [Cladorrhinum samala]|uniref:Ankyrin repeat protein n=1 Tax=Cladorrhinum samala TaxID=585594 RepID=A0AAV9HW81_9PEZI|nr:hypothetical protein QBC42DRAFT_344196 [Cladorrhinum samala]